MATRTNISLSIDQVTVRELQQAGFWLYAFKGVHTIMGGGAPLVWFRSQAFFQHTSIDWQERYQAYISQDAIAHGSRIDAIATCNIEIGQTMEVDSSTGTARVISGSPPGAIGIQNRTTQQMTCGLCQVVGDAPASLCAFPLYANVLDVMTPSQRVVLMFATQPLEPSAVVTRVPSQALMIEMDGLAQRSVSFDINRGWSWDGGVWARPVSPSADLASLLITAGPER